MSDMLGSKPRVEGDYKQQTGLLFMFSSVSHFSVLIDRAPYQDGIQRISKHVH